MLKNISNLIAKLTGNRPTSIPIEALDASPFLIMYWNSKFECIGGNKLAMEFQRIAAPSLGDWQAHLAEALKNGQSQFEFVAKRGRRKTDTEAYFDVICQQVEVAGDISLITYANDITSIKEVQEDKDRASIAEANSQAKTRFLARMSHEIRTPISAVLGISEIQLQNKENGAKTSEAFAKIYNSSGILLGLINDILDISKIEAGQMSIAQNKYDMKDLISDVIELQTANLQSKKFKFVVKLDENLPRFLVGDELRIKQILVNTISNAFKYTETGLVSFSIKCTEDRRKPDHILLTIVVSDTGHGMTESQLNDIFKEYTRFHESSEYIAGTGLGMPIVYNLVKMMDAEVDVQSVVEAGTTVTIRIPQKLSDSELVLGEELAAKLEQFETGIKERAFKIPAESMPYGKVLLVDDVETNNYVAKGLLNFYDINVDICNSGQEAIDKIKKGAKYDVVFMDYMMPGFNGIETTQILRSIGYDAPIVALTANVVLGQEREFMENNFDGFLSKPIESSRLNEVLVKFVKDHKEAKVEGYYDQPELLDKIRQDFAKTQKNALVDIQAAIEKGDFEFAERSAHIIKGLAVYIKEENLNRAAEVLQTALNAKAVSAEVMRDFEEELKKVLAGLEA